MAEDVGTISLEPAGNDFILRRTASEGMQSEMVLSQADVLILAQSAQRLTGQILKGLRRPGAVPVVLTPVAQVGLTTDLHKSVIHLTMVDPGGARMGFALPPEVARPLAERLPVYLAELKASTKQ